MKRGLFYLVALVMLAGCVPKNDGVSESVTEDDIPDKGMTVSSTGIIDGIIEPIYGINSEHVTNGVPTLSLPLDIQNAPEGTVCYAIYMDDPDAKPLCGYDWVHWTAVNIEQSAIPEGFSSDAGDAIQGTNDFKTTGYGGPAPPDKDHTYVIAVYALDTALDLSEGFSKTEFAAAVKGHALAKATLEGIYEKDAR